MKVKVYLPISKKKKNNIRGFWLADDKKLYYDYIKIVKADISELEALKQKYKQLAIFYTYKNKAYIYHNKNKIEVLNKCLRFIFIYDICSIKEQFKKLLKKYNGFTCYIENDYILAEVWQ